MGEITALARLSVRARTRRLLGQRNRVERNGLRTGTTGRWVVALVLLGILAAASGTAGHANADDQRVIPYG
ncbi:hypothetical protein [Streptomyces canus]|uniref:hypothetical protein n=1 Tax=Streptomyces canus TaxID=58343 RepID=UPI002DDBD712|nr:hypothetical protein [Streptomyces canus]WSD83547.1 hypothetical protein OG925_04245 [Streptomyces canus]